MSGGRIPDGPLVTFEDIVDALRHVQVGRGAVVYAHSSLSSMGYVPGGAAHGGRKHRGAAPESGPVLRGR